MPSTFFQQWADDFDHRLRFGIPTLPIIRREAAVPPTIVSLPPRSGTMRFPDADVDAVLSLLADCHPGQAVRLTDEPDDSDNTARRRSEIMKEQIMARGDNVIAAGWKLRGHVLTEGEPTVEEKTSAKSGKTYKVTTYPRNFAAISLVAESEPDEPPADGEEPAGDTPPAASTAAARRRRGGGDQS